MARMSCGGYGVATPRFYVRSGKSKARMALAALVALGRKGRRDEIMNAALTTVLLTLLSLTACSQRASEGVPSMNVAEHVISLERAALDRWIRADPDGYLRLYAKDATYFDPFSDRRIAGVGELKAMGDPSRG